jgi:hypothetical protein
MYQVINVGSQGNDLWGEAFGKDVIQFGDKVAVELVV